MGFCIVSLGQTFHHSFPCRLIWKKILDTAGHCCIGCKCIHTLRLPWTHHNVISSIPSRQNERLLVFSVHQESTKLAACCSERVDVWVVVDLDTKRKKCWCCFVFVGRNWRLDDIRIFRQMNNDAMFPL
jgi:hypothetical protein